MSRLTDDQRKLVEDNIGLVGYTICRFMHMIEKFDEKDAYQQGCLGLINAAMKYKPELGIAFSTYAVNGIHLALCEWLRHMMTGREQLNRTAVRIDRPPIGYDDDPFSTVADNLTSEVFDDYDIYAQDIIDLIRARFKPVNLTMILMLAAGYKQTEVARHLGVTKQCINQAVKRVRKVIEDEYLKES